jgi:hypothetical protein
MSFLLFAFEQLCPAGGLDDVVARFERRPTDREMFDAVVSEIRNDELALELVLCVQLVPAPLLELEAAEYFEFRSAQRMSSSALDFSSVVEDLPDLGPCALVPVTRVADPNGVVREYCSRDPDQTLF